MSDYDGKLCGLGLIGAPLAENQPVTRLAVVAETAEIITKKVMETRMGLPGEAYEQGQAKRYGQIAGIATVAGVLTTALLGPRRRSGRRRRLARRLRDDPLLDLRSRPRLGRRSEVHRGTQRQRLRDRQAQS